MNLSSIVMLAAMIGVPILSSCSSVPTKTCSAVVAHSPTEYDVCVNSGAVQAGSRVAFFKERCTTASRGSPRKCSKEKVGEGSILKILDDHLSTVKLDEPFDVTESMTIEPKK